ncbi:unnamed protein product [Auanema sp. JU1783]|nr:unnamed protein product [Auanema sp. JU1783]
MERSLLNDSGCHSLILSVGKANDDDNLSETAFTPYKVVNSEKAGLPICSSVIPIFTRKRKSNSFDNLSAEVKRSALLVEDDKPHYSSQKYVNYEYMVSNNEYDCNNNNNNVNEENSEKNFFTKASTSSDSDIHSPLSLLNSPNEDGEEDVSEFLDSEYIRIVDEDGNYVFYKKGEYEHSCAWTKCEVSFPTAEGLYDHIIETHVDYLKTIEIVPAQVICYFDDCEMYIARGDRERKYMWLAKHIRDRHCTDARTYKCLMENCPERFSCPTKLEAHVRNEHILSAHSTKNSPNEKVEKKKDALAEKKSSNKEAKGKKMEGSGGKKKEEDVIEDDDFYNKDDPNSCFGLMPIQQQRHRTDANRFLWMPSHDNILLRMYRDLLAMKYDYYVVPNHRIGVGATHRKSRAVQRIRLYPSRPIQYSCNLKEDYDNSFVSIKTKADRVAVVLCKPVSDSKKKRSLNTEEAAPFCNPFLRNKKRRNVDLALIRRSLHETQHLQSKNETTLDDLFPGWNYEEKKEDLWTNHPNRLLLDKYHQRCANRNEYLKAEEEVYLKSCRLTDSSEELEEDMLEESSCDWEEDSDSESSSDEDECSEELSENEDSDGEDCEMEDHKKEIEDCVYYEEYADEFDEDDDSDDDDDEDYIGDDIEMEEN